MLTGQPDLMTPGEVAVWFRVDPKTVTRWVHAGWFPEGSYFKTPGGHHRFYREEIQAMIDTGRPNHKAHG